MIMNQSCRVCGEAAAGYHFGAFTCEGCKSFFGRTYNNRSSIGECKNNNSCIINKKNRTSCKSCRLKRCFTVGMSKSGSRYGRRSNWFKIHCLLQDQGMIPPQTATQLSQSQVDGQDELESQNHSTNIAQNDSAPNPNALQSLNPNALQDINPNPLQNLNPNALQDINPNALQNINPNALQNINPNALQNINPNALQNINPNALSSLSNININSDNNNSIDHHNTLPFLHNMMQSQDAASADPSSMYASALAQFFAYCYLVSQRPS